MRWTLALMLILTASLGATAAAPAHTQQSALERRAAFELQVVRELNQARAAQGLPRLRSQPGLRAAASGHSRSMLAAGFFSHESPDGTPFHNRIRRHYPARGFETWFVGETLLSNGGVIDARSVVAAWLESASHRAIVLSRGWREVGVGAFYRPDAPGAFAGAATLVVTADFGLRARS